MFNRKKSNPVAAALDALLPKQEPKHRVRNGAVVIGLALGSAIAAGALKKGSEQ